MTEKKGNLPVCDEHTGTLRATARALRQHGFGKCIVDDRPCAGATVLDPGQNRKRVTLCCAVRRESVSPEDAKKCTRQQ